MSEDDKTFLSRWSRLKRKARRGAGEDSPATAPPAAVPAPNELPPPAEAELDLPDIASLARDSDYTGFLRPGVPVETQRQALRALWKSDPIFAHQDGLTDYADDFRNPAVVGAAVKTAWKLGRGFLDDPAEEKKAVAAAGDEAAAEQRDEPEADPA